MVTKGLIFCYILGSFATDALIVYELNQSHIINITYTLRGFTLFEIIAFSLFFILVLRDKWLRLLITTAFIVFLVIFVQNWHAPSQQFDSLPASTGAIICIFFALAYLYSISSNPKKNVKLFVGANFWFSMGILIYMAGNLFMFITYNKFNPREADHLAVLIFPLMNILKNIFFSVGMLKKEN